ncbi:hypothetical protein F9U44_09450 [Pectobacterium versatile]|nr:hypothetical protein [Pectobacterium versatile]
MPPTIDQTRPLLEPRWFYFAESVSPDLTGFLFVTQECQLAGRSINAIICAAILRARGNVARLVDVLRF